MTGEATIILDGGMLAVLVKIARDMGTVTNQVNNNTEDIDEIKEEVGVVAD